MIIELLDQMILQHIVKWGNGQPKCFILSEINFRMLEREIECKYPVDIVGRWDKKQYKGIAIVQQQDACILL